MSKQQNKKNKALGQLTFFVIALALCAYSLSQHQYEPATLFGLSVVSFILWLIAVHAPTTCGVTTLDGHPCTRRIDGILFGCQDHTWAKLFAWFGYRRKIPTRRTRSQDMHSPPAQAVANTGKPEKVSGIDESLKNVILFWATIISTAAGVGSVVVSIIALP